MKRFDVARNFSSLEGSAPDRLVGGEGCHPPSSHDIRRAHFPPSKGDSWSVLLISNSSK